MGCLRSGNTGYIGRFAPSPSGPLHFGSLIAALASYLDARAHNGQWLLRMEDLDPARQPPQAASQILATLEAFHLHWDGAVIYQSQRLPAYQEALEQLRVSQLVYPCRCSRQTIRAMGGVYDGRCRLHPPLRKTSCAQRVHVADSTIGFVDRIQGPQCEHLPSITGDFVVLRKDGLFAYQLAVVVDDAWQQITHIVRGSDLLNSTARQIHLQRLLHLPLPQYAHIPVAVNELGQKLSKQHFATPVADDQPSASLFLALRFLGQNLPAELVSSPPAELLAQAVKRWDIQAVPKLATIPV